MESPPKAKGNQGEARRTKALQPKNGWKDPCPATLKMSSASRNLLRAEKSHQTMFCLFPGQGVSPTETRGPELNSRWIETVSEGPGGARGKARRPRDLRIARGSSPLALLSLRVPSSPSPGLPLDPLGSQVIPKPRQSLENRSFLIPLRAL